MFELNRKTIVIFLITLIALCNNLLAQDQQSMLPLFDYEIVSLPGTSLQAPTTQVFVWVRNSYLQYVTRDTLYSARYQINLDVNRENGSSVLTDDKTYSVAETNYAATIDPKIQHVHLFELQLPPADYNFQIRLFDLNSTRSRVQERKKKVRSFEAARLEISDLLFLTACDNDTIKADQVIPSFSLPIQDKIYLYSVIITPGDGQEVELLSTISRKDGNQIFKFSQRITPTKKLTKVCLEIAKENMRRGENQLLLKITDNIESKSVRKELRFIAGVEGFVGQSIADMIEPLSYIADSEDWKKLKDASDEDRETVFKEFWAKRDPNPGSPENELFDEFYKRVEFANRQFGLQRTFGWKTSRGQVFIIYGQPERVERSNPSAYSQAVYEIWYYDELREKFVFLDEFGFGDFKLVSGNLRPSY